MVTQTAAAIWRDYQTDGVPASGASKPAKREIRAWGGYVESLINSAGGGLGYATLALLNADLAHAANQLAFVFSDAVAANNGLYEKSGASGIGSWSRVGDLPNSVVLLTDLGTGTANSIIASANETPVLPGNKLYLLTPALQNTTTTMITVNGGVPVEIKNAFGVSLASGSLLSANTVLMAWVVDHYQLLISASVDASAILAAAQAAQTAAAASAAAAAASAASVAILAVVDRTALKAVDTTVSKTVILREAGREGTFLWTTGNFAALVTVDTQEGIYIKANAIATTSGAWVRVRTEGVFNVKWFGAAGDNTTDDTTAINKAIALANALSGGDILLPKGGYKISATLALTSPLVRILGVGKRYCSITSTATNISLITISAARCAVENLSIFNLVQPTVQKGLIELAAGSVQCTLRDLDMVGGWYCLYVDGGANCFFNDIVARLAWGGSTVYCINAGAMIFADCVFDQDWPVAVPGAANDKGARGNTTAYVAHDFVSSGGMFLQCKTPGTSGGSPPSLTGVWFGQDIADGSVVWNVAGNTSGSAVQVDSGCTYITFKDTDMTGSYLSGAQITNNLGTTAPDVIRIVDCTMAGMVAHGINVVAGKGLWLEGNEVQASVGAAVLRAGIVVGSGITGELLISRNRVTSNIPYGLYVAANSFGSFLIQSNAFLGCTTAGINMSAGANNFVITGNNCGGSSAFGNNAAAIVVGVGASDYYMISQNRVHGATTGITDGGTGVNKSITGNV